MRIAEARRRPVVDTSTAQTVGHVDGFLIEPESARITGLRVTADKSTSILPWEELAAFGPDAVTIADVNVLRAPSDPGEQHRSDPALDPIGKPAIEETGNGLGTIADVDFDPNSGALRAVITDAYELPADKMVGLGSYAMVFGNTGGLTPA